MNRPDAPAALAFEVNGRRVELSVAPGARLSDVLRDTLGLTGTKVGCHAGDCGACTVLLDDEQVCACLVAVGQWAGRRVRTVEGLANSAFKTPTLRGVVVTTCLGFSPILSANCNMSQASSARFHLANSSTQAASNCGPRRLSGSCAEKTCATAPLGQTNRLRPASHSGRRSGGEQAKIPLSPNTITSRA